MNIDSLNMFIYVVEQGSISKVSEEMSISQSALSQRIKAMEEEYGAQLLERTYKGVIPTALGNLVYHHGKKITDSYNQMLEEITQVKNENRIIHIFSTPTMYSYVLPCALYQIKKKYPSYMLKMETISSRSLENKIAQGTADIGFIIGKPKDKNLVSKKIFSDKVFLVAGNQIEIPEKITINEIYRYPILMLSKGQKSRQILDSYMQKIGIDVEGLQILYNLDSTESIKVSAVNGYGLAFLPYMAIKKELYNKQLRIIDLEGFNFENHYYSIKQQHHKDMEISKVTQYIEKSITDIIC